MPFIPLSREAFSPSSKAADFVNVLEKLVWNKSFHCLSLQDLKKHEKPMQNSPSNEFSTLIGYFTRYNHRALMIPFHFQCDLFIFVSFSKIDMKISHYYLTRVPEYYRDMLHSVVPQGKDKPQLCSLRLGNYGLQFSSHAVLGLQ